MNDLLMALWFFLPAGIANMTPIFASQLPILKNWTAPLDFGLKFRGQRIFGDHKTWRGLISGMIVGVLVVYLQALLIDTTGWAASAAEGINYGQLSLLALGITLGAGALLGDAVKSFFKRRFSIASGKSWFPFDQVDYIIGAALLSAPVVKLPLGAYVWALAIGFVLHLLFSYLGYRLGLKKYPI